jgi:hypothetical protein
LLQLVVFVKKINLKNKYKQNGQSRKVRYQRS